MSNEQSESEIIPQPIQPEIFDGIDISGMSESAKEKIRKHFQPEVKPRIAKPAKREKVLDESGRESMNGMSDNLKDLYPVEYWRSIILHTDPSAYKNWAKHLEKCKSQGRKHRVKLSEVRRYEGITIQSQEPKKTKEFIWKQ